MFKDLDPLLHSQLRLSIVSILVSVESAEFNYLLEKTKATKGNLSVQINKLAAASYIEVTKSFRKNYPLTSCKITPKGIAAFQNYVDAISGYLNTDKET
jgi:DNA-binding MarR family transcriptional regulator